MERYFYLIWASIFLALWLVLFLRRKDTRKEMSFTSILFGFAALGAEKTNIQDWWHPITITGTPIGLEDFMIGFVIAGIAAVIYEEICQKHLIRIKKRGVAPSNPSLFLLLFPLLYMTLFFLLDLGSAYSAIFTYLPFIIYMLYTRKDLLLDSLISGLLMLVVGTSIYFLLFTVHPTYINDFWYLPDYWYSSLLWGIPIGEYLWFFLTGAYIGPLYEYMRKLRLSKY